MVGMLQIITYLLCVYLIFKGFEILQIALASTLDNRSGIILIGVIMVVISIGGALYFTQAIDRQAQSVANRAAPAE